MNNIIKLSVIICFGMAISACATNTSAPSTVQTQTAKAQPKEHVKDVKDVKTAKNDADKKVCKRTQQIGTRFKKKFCMTRGQWDKMQEESRAAASEIQRRGGQQGNPNGN